MSECSGKLLLNCICTVNVMDTVIKVVDTRVERMDMLYVMFCAGANVKSSLSL
jgi:hypothetical protein